MKNLTLVLLSLFVSVAAVAGEGGTEIQCRSSSGKTLVEVMTSDGGDMMMKASLTNADGKTNTIVTFVNKWFDENLQLNGRTLQQELPGAKVAPIVGLIYKHFISFVVVEISPDGAETIPLKLVSLPNTLKLQKGPYESVKGTFQAQFSGLDPRSKNSPHRKYLNEIQVICTYNYSI